MLNKPTSKFQHPLGWLTSAMSMNGAKVWHHPHPSLPIPHPSSGDGGQMELLLLQMELALAFVCTDPKDRAPVEDFLAWICILDHSPFLKRYPSPLAQRTPLVYILSYTTRLWRSGMAAFFSGVKGLQQSLKHPFQTHFLEGFFLLPFVIYSPSFLPFFLSSFLKL